MRPVLTRGRVAAAILVVGILALGVVFLMAPSAYDVQDKGRGPGIVPYESGLIYKVRVLDSFTVYAPEEARPDPDKVSSLGLAVATTMMLMTFLLLTAAGSGPRLRVFYALGAAGLALATVDETFALHETIGHNMHFLGDVPGIERPDDLIFAFYPIALAFFAWHFRDILFADRRATRLFAAGSALVLVAVAGDIIGSHVDEAAEPLAGLCLVVGLVMLTARHLREELVLDQPYLQRIGPITRSPRSARLSKAAR